ncbi:MAG: hypothetical protein H6713_39680 [Myxococcales bacterium]|nr:hypothetical protein [Myxococcales bacterium]
MLQLRGSPREMGFAHGALLRDDILRVVSGYVLADIPSATFNAFAGVFAAVADIDPALREEAEGLLAGMEHAGGAHVEALGRALTPSDLLLMNAMTDLVAIGCSSLSTWGDATRDDPALAGELAIVRNLDWSSNPALLESQVIIAYAPSDPQSQPLVSVAFAGYIGCLSCMNAAGVGALFNMGYGDGHASLAEAAAGFAPANLLLRRALQARDVDGDGRSTADDVARALADGRHAGSYIVHLVEPNRVASELGRAPARVVEVEADGVAARGPEADARLGPHALAATNHLRARATPTSCGRYQRLERGLAASGARVDRERLWSLGESTRIERDVVHTLMLVPERRALSLRARAPGRSMADSPARVDHRWDELFADAP